MSQSEAVSLSLNGLSHLCQRESELFFQHRSFDPQYCFELFRRAFVEQCQEAWEYVYQQYRQLVLSWIARHPLSNTMQEEADYFLNRAFEKMWSVLNPQKFSEFPDLKSLLRYLQMCVHSVIIDYSRLNEQASLLEDGEEPVQLAFGDPPEPDGGVENQVAHRQQAAALWQWLDQRLKTEQERVLAYGFFVMEMKPRQILDEYPGVFGSIAEIYSAKENLLDRLRRDEELLQRLTGLETARNSKKAAKNAGKKPPENVNKGRKENIS